MSTDDNGVPIEQRVESDGRITFKKVERRPIPKPPLNFKPRFKPNSGKQVKIGSVSGNSSDRHFYPDKICFYAAVICLLLLLL